jgi:hypothetical protein
MIRSASIVGRYLDELLPTDPDEHAPAGSRPERNQPERDADRSSGRRKNKSRVEIPRRKADVFLTAASS